MLSLTGSIAAALVRCSPSNFSVRVARRLDVGDLQDVILGKCAAVRIPGFCSKSVCEHAMKELRSREIVDYHNATGVGKFKGIGMAYFEAENDQSRKELFSQVHSSILGVRCIFDPFRSPIDEVRLTLDEQWSPGASLLRHGEGKIMYAGLMRAIKGSILPHEDKLDRDDSDLASRVHYVGQVAFNCYLSMPPVGGEIQLWNLSLETSKYDELRGDSYGIDRDKLPPPDLTIRPEEGEFIAFNGRNIHAVTACAQGVLRTTVSGFMLYQGEDRPLHVWS